MSSNASARRDSAGIADEKIDEYDEMLDTLDAAIRQAREKVESGRVYDAENEKVRIKWVRCLAYAVNVRRQVQNDRDLAELAEEIDQLKNAAGLETDR